MNTITVLAVSVLIILSFVLIFKLYRDVKNKQKEISIWYHVSMLFIIPITTFINILTGSYVLFYVEDYFAIHSYPITLIGVVITFVFLFLTLLFYISAVDELLNNKLNHEKVTFFEKLGLLFSILFGKEKMKELN